MSKILITGATSPLGQHFAKHYAKSDNILFLHSRDKENLSKLINDLPNNCKVYSLICDFTKKSDFDNVFNELSTYTEYIDILINNAFGQVEEEIENVSFDESNEFYNVSLNGTYQFTKRTMPFLKKGKIRKIINIVADWGIPMHNIMTGPSIYISGKYGVYGLGVALQTELSKINIHVTNLCPGAIAADFIGTDDEFEKEIGAELIHPKEI